MLFQLDLSCLFLTLFTVFFEFSRRCSKFLKLQRWRQNLSVFDELCWIHVCVCACLFVHVYARVINRRHSDLVKDFVFPFIHLYLFSFSVFSFDLTLCKSDEKFWCVVSRDIGTFRTMSPSYTQIIALTTMTTCIYILYLCFSSQTLEIAMHREKVRNDVTMIEQAGTSQNNKKNLAKSVCALAMIVIYRQYLCLRTLSLSASYIYTIFSAQATDSGSGVFLNESIFQSLKSQIHSFIHLLLLYQHHHRRRRRSWIFFFGAKQSTTKMCSSVPRLESRRFAPLVAIQ